MCFVLERSNSRIRDEVAIKLICVYHKYAIENKHNGFAPLSLSFISRDASHVGLITR